jgi:hypothetical protein
MPQVGSLVDDEIQQLEGTLKTGVSTGSARVLRVAELQDVKTQRALNQFWPPAPADD